MVANAKDSPKQGIDFETAISELEKVVAALEGEVKLEVALELFERGIKLSSTCEKFLAKAEQKVSLLKRTAEGELALEPFAADAGQTPGVEEDNK